MAGPVVVFKMATIEQFRVGFGIIDYRVTHDRKKRPDWSIPKGKAALEIYEIYIACKNLMACSSIFIQSIAEVSLINGYRTY